MPQLEAVEMVLIKVVAQVSVNRRCYFSAMVILSRHQHGASICTGLLKKLSGVIVGRGRFCGNVFFIYSSTVSVARYTPGD